MAIQFKFPQSRNIAYQLSDIDEIYSFLNWDYTIWGTSVASAKGTTVKCVEIWGPKGLWYKFNKPYDQWIALTDWGIPFEAFESKEELIDYAEKNVRLESPMIEDHKGTCYFLSQYPYVGINLKDTDLLSRKLNSDWLLASREQMSEDKFKKESIEILSPDDVWYRFDNPAEQWVILSEVDGTPIDVFDSRAELEEAAKNLNEFCEGEISIETVIRS